MDWWCQLFGYFNCRSIPTDEAIIFWGGSALAGAVLAILTVRRVLY